MQAKKISQQAKAPFCRECAVRRCRPFRVLLRDSTLEDTAMRKQFQTIVILSVAIVAMSAGGNAQQPAIGVPVPPLGAGPFVLDTAEQHKIRITVVTKGLVHPWSVAFLPDGSMLVTERPGRLRVIRDGVLDPKPVSGVSDVRTKGNGGLMDIALHPRFAENHLLYFTYTKPVENDRGAPTVARGR